MSRNTKVSPLKWNERAEAALLEGLRKGSESAFSALYLQYFDRLFALSLGYINDREQARNAVQETFLRVFRKIHTFRGESGLGTWIYRIAVNVCLNESKKQSRIREICSTASEIEDLAGRSVVETGEERAARRELLAIVGGLLQRLEPAKRATFLLFYIEELTADEIAEVMGEGRGTVLKRLQRTRSELVEMACDARILDVVENDLDTRGS
jgi:RNA polymerase sigma-70 factor (ECF subfamily)